MPSQPITVVPAAHHHVETIVEFNAAMGRETENRTLDLAVLRPAVEAVLHDPSLAQYWIAEVGGRPVGQLMLTSEWSDWRNCRFWWIQSVYVVPDLRGAGVYRALHQHVERQARAQPGVGGLRLYVDRHNTTAQEVYRRLGMTETNYLMFETDWAGL